MHIAQSVTLQAPCHLFIFMETGMIAAIWKIPLGSGSDFALNHPFIPKLVYPPHFAGGRCNGQAQYDSKSSPLFSTNWYAHPAPL